MEILLMYTTLCHEHHLLYLIDLDFGSIENDGLVWNQAYCEDGSSNGHLSLRFPSYCGNRKRASFSYLKVH